MGQLTLARAELEDLLRRDELDVGGLTALAEARWRTGDGAGATEAAVAHLESGGTDDVALCIAAEAAAADGRTDDANELMDRLPAADAATLDVLFAGMPRRAFWPAGPVDRSDLDELRPGQGLRRHGVRVAPHRPAASPGEASLAARSVPAREGAAPSRAVPGPSEVIAAMEGADWESARGTAESRSVDGTRRAPARPADAQAGRERRRVRGQLDPVAELEAARNELATKPDRAFLRLSLVLRHDPTLAPAVLQILDLRREPTAALVRGDAQRLLGRHLEAEAAFDVAAESLEAS
jgi:hypothetical protein